MKKKVIAMEKPNSTNPESTPEEPSHDAFSRLFFWVIPFTAPLIITGGTYLFYTIVPLELIWLPLLLLYWATIWIFTLLYRAKRGGVFSRERFKPTVKLQGDHLWAQYILVYGPLFYAIPLFVINYATLLSVAMYGAIIIASIINGFSEEVYWRACLDDAGKNAGVSTRKRLAFAPVVFAFWHTAFVIHLFPWDPISSWLMAWGGILFITWTSGLIWLWVLHRSGRIVPQCIYHVCGNFLNIFPMILITVLHFYF